MRRERPRGFYTKQTHSQCAESTSACRTAGGDHQVGVGDVQRTTSLKDGKVRRQQIHYMHSVMCISAVSSFGYWEGRIGSALWG